MAEQRIIGVSVTAAEAREAVDRITHLEELGVGCAWLTSSGGGGEAVTVLAGAAAVTDEIRLGTSIVQTWSRHPVTLAQQVQVLDSLAPGRFRLGVGPSHKAGMISAFGGGLSRAYRTSARVHSRLARAASYGRGGVRGAVVLRQRLYLRAGGRSDNGVGAGVRARSRRAASSRTARLAGSARTSILRDTAVPAMRRGAESAGREAPPLIAHAPVCVTEDLEAARNGVRARLGYFPSIPFYANMFAEAGFAGTPDSGWTNEMLDEVLIAGDEAAVAERIQTVFDWGAG